MNDQQTALYAESLRRDHCERKETIHKCIGVVSIKPGFCMFDCQVCGTTTISTVSAMRILDSEANDGEGI